ncbi:uncharacterized protein LOC114576501 [Exaiptasia diaphana]|uniref:Chromo domain-containing protein n=1 Tax=Exaiptasia diaphana TaxID=2652724 RepID=A0A913YU76_EXADI|nr:uncharacterized protein LOC114576501 [Exaiptasia diaphana]KXJ06830.1 hypothetical protein AC249_AIPGENE12633 [Exaiptasia diaphana]
MFEELCQYSNKADIPLGAVLISNNNICRFCGSQLRVKNRAKQVAKVVIYDEQKGTFLASHYTKFCTKESCKFRQYYGKYTLTGDDMYFDPDWMQNRYFLSTSETAFDMDLLKNFDHQLLIGQISYQQKSRIYNATNGYDANQKKKKKKAVPDLKENKTQESHQNLSTSESILEERKQLDRRRLEDGHLQFAILRIMESYPDEFNCQSTSFKDLKELLTSITPVFHEAFIKRFAGHSCTYPGCRNVLVIDGNMKISREVCKAKDVGFLQYKGLEGSIKSGCLKSPAFESRYCEDHKDFACELKIASSDETASANENDTGEMFQSGPVTRAMAKASGDPSGDIPEDGIIEKILDVKITRAKAYYKVKFLGQKEEESLSWEPEEDVPSHLINLYKSKIQLNIAIKETNYNGQLSRRFISVPKVTDEPEVKRQKTSVEIPKAGVLFKEKFNINCNTEKDKGKRQRKNERTAGILCGLRPCGVFVTVAELYGCESNSQVYAILHEALRKNAESFKMLEYLVYDDACHLRKYAQNPIRSELTEQTKTLRDIEIVVDKMHMRGHVDPWCKKHCDSRKIEELAEVDTEVCEQSFSWLSLYKKMTRKMNQEHFMFLVLYLLHLHNVKEETKLLNGGYLSAT